MLFSGYQHPVPFLRIASSGMPFISASSVPSALSGSSEPLQMVGPYKFRVCLQLPLTPPLVLS